MFIPNNNEMMELGYKYAVGGNYKVKNTIDPWSGMPDLDYTVEFFKEKEEAEEYAKTQIFPFSGESPAVHKLTYVKTLEDYERERKEKAEKRKAREVKKASEMGMTVEEYRKEKARKAKITRLENEIAELEEELKNKKNYLKRLTK